MTKYFILFSLVIPFILGVVFMAWLGVPGFLLAVLPAILSSQVGYNLEHRNDRRPASTQ